MTSQSRIPYTDVASEEDLEERTAQGNKLKAVIGALHEATLDFLEALQADTADEDGDPIRVDPEDIPTIYQDYRALCQEIFKLLRSRPVVLETRDRCSRCTCVECVGELRWRELEAREREVREREARNREVREQEARGRETRDLETLLYSLVCLVILMPVLPYVPSLIAAVSGLWPS
ncbi:hypothetical protein F4780DRAFT_780860 [Xylariomycetidae sp. FL0641]|nr:hypothetical protein F4780DRAFT_780860 [Xylariomycetidae sp. FL0641]